MKRILAASACLALLLSAVVTSASVNTEGYYARVGRRSGGTVYYKEWGASELAEGKTTSGNVKTYTVFQRLIPETFFSLQFTALDPDSDSGTTAWAYRKEDGTFKNPRLRSSWGTSIGRFHSAYDTYSDSEQYYSYEYDFEVQFRYWEGGVKRWLRLNMEWDTSWPTMIGL